MYKNQLTIPVFSMIAIVLLAFGGPAMFNHTTGGKDIRKADWLIGTWENKTSRGTIYESWTKTNEMEFYGKSYGLRGQDTMVFENIRLVQQPDGLHYIPTVKGQNDDQPVTFRSTSITDDKLVFENPEHDFPQIISYTKIAQDSLVAEISGLRGGEEKSIKFPMRRVNL